MFTIFLKSCWSYHSRKHCTFISLIYLFNDFMYVCIYLPAILIRTDSHEEPHRWFLQLVPMEAETSQTELVSHDCVIMDFSKGHLSISDIWWPATDWLKQSSQCYYFLIVAVYFGTTLGTRWTSSFMFLSVYWGLMACVRHLSTPSNVCLLE